MSFGVVEEILYSCCVFEFKFVEVFYFVFYFDGEIAVFCFLYDEVEDHRVFVCVRSALIFSEDVREILQTYLKTTEVFDERSMRAVGCFVVIFSPVVDVILPVVWFVWMCS